jgi:hypothetical protein
VSGAIYKEGLNIKQHATTYGPFNRALPVISRVAGSVPTPVRSFIAYKPLAAILTFWVLLTNVPAAGEAHFLFYRVENYRCVWFLTILR